jgi:hypothetical protein
MEDNIKIDSKEYEGKVWSGINWLRIGTLVDTVMNLQVPQNAGHFLRRRARRTQQHAVSSY